MLPRRCVPRAPCAQLDAAPGSFPGGGGGLFEPASLEGCDLPDLLLGAGEPAGWLEGDSGASTLEHGSAGGGASSGGGHDATPSSSHGWPAPALSPCVQQRSDTAVVPDAADSNRGAAGGVQPEQLSDAELKRQVGGGDFLCASGLPLRPAGLTTRPGGAVKRLE